MAMYRPALPFATQLIVLKPTFIKAGGVRSKVLPSLDEGFKIYASFKSYGGTEKTVDGIYSIEDTANIETWYRPDITSDCLIVLPNANAEPETWAVYEILNEPENISQRNQFLKFKVKRVKGGT